MNGPYTRPKKTWPLIVVIVFLLGTTFYFWRDARQSAVALEARPADQSQEVADLKKQLKAQATTTATTTVTGFTQAQMDEQVQKAVDDFKAKNPPCLKKDHQPPKKPKAQQAKPPAPKTEKKVEEKLAQNSPAEVPKKDENCRNEECLPKPKATVQKEVAAKVCGIGVQKSISDPTIIARLQLDENPDHPGVLRIAVVSSFEGVASQVSRTSLPIGKKGSNGKSDCNEDQAKVYQNWPAIITKFNLPLECVPVKMN